MIGEFLDFFIGGKGCLYKSTTDISQYFGQKLGYYFAWILYQSYQMIPLILLGIGFFMIEYLTANNENNKENENEYLTMGNIRYMYFMLGQQFLVFINQKWTRKNMELNTRWGNIQYLEDLNQNDQQINDKFKGDLIINSETGNRDKIKVYGEFKMYCYRLFLQIINIILIIALIIINLVIEFVDFQYQKDQISSNNQSSSQQQQLGQKHYFEFRFDLFGKEQSVDCKNMIIGVIVEIFCMLCSLISFTIVEHKNFKYQNQSYEMLSDYMFPILLVNNLGSVLIKLVVDSLSENGTENILNEKKVSDIQSLVILRIMGISFFQFIRSVFKMNIIQYQFSISKYRKTISEAIQRKKKKVEVRNRLYEQINRSANPQEYKDNTVIQKKKSISVIKNIFNFSKFNKSVDQDERKKFFQENQKFNIKDDKVSTILSQYQYDKTQDLERIVLRVQQANNQQNENRDKTIKYIDNNDHKIQLESKIDIDDVEYQSFRANLQDYYLIEFYAYQMVQFSLFNLFFCQSYFFSLVMFITTQLDFVFHMKLVLKCYQRPLAYSIKGIQNWQNYQKIMIISGLFTNSIWLGILSNYYQMFFLVFISLITQRLIGQYCNRKPDWVVQSYKKFVNTQSQQKKSLQQLIQLEQQKSKRIDQQYKSLLKQQNAYYFQKINSQYQKKQMLDEMIQKQKNQQKIKTVPSLKFDDEMFSNVIFSIFKYKHMLIEKHLISQRLQQLSANLNYINQLCLKCNVEISVIECKDCQKVFCESCYISEHHISKDKSKQKAHSEYTLIDQYNYQIFQRIKEKGINDLQDQHVQQDEQSQDDQHQKIQQSNVTKQVTITQGHEFDQIRQPLWKKVQYFCNLDEIYKDEMRNSNFQLNSSFISKKNSNKISANDIKIYILKFIKKSQYFKLINKELYQKLYSFYIKELGLDLEKKVQDTYQYFDQDSFLFTQKNSQQGIYENNFNYSKSIQDFFDCPYFNIEDKLFINRIAFLEFKQYQHKAKFMGFAQRYYNFIKYAPDIIDNPNNSQQVEPENVIYFQKLNMIAQIMNNGNECVNKYDFIKFVSASMIKDVNQFQDLSLVTDEIFLGRQDIDISEFRQIAELQKYMPFFSELLQVQVNNQQKDD